MSVASSQSPAVRT